MSVSFQNMDTQEVFQKINELWSPASPRLQPHTAGTLRPGTEERALAGARGWGHGLVLSLCWGAKVHLSTWGADSEFTPAGPLLRKHLQASRPLPPQEQG